MNKLYVLPLLLGAVALSSCSAFTITVDQARDKLKTVIDQATANGKYIGGKYLTRRSTLSNVTYDLDTAIVEEHRLDNFYYFDIDNNYFRFDSIQTDLITDYNGTTKSKTVEIDYYSYILNSNIYNTVITTVNGIIADKYVFQTPVDTLSVKQFINVRDMYYAEFVEVYEEALMLMEEVVVQDDDFVSWIGGQFESYGDRSLTFYATQLIENTNVYIDYRYAQLYQFETFDRYNHILRTETMNYNSFSLNYAM